MDKSYVTLEQAICPICGKAHDTGNLLLDKRLRKKFDMHTATHYDLCPEHQKLSDDGYIALVECKNKDVESLTVENADRTGNLVHIRRSAWGKIFGIELPSMPMAFVEEGMIEKLAAKYQEASP